MKPQEEFIALTEIFDFSNKILADLIMQTTFLEEMLDYDQHEAKALSDYAQSVIAAYDSDKEFI